MIRARSERTPAITSGEEETMSDEKTNAEPSGASGGSLANAHSARQDAEAKIIVDGIAEIMRIASEPDWIPVTERLPEPDYMGNAVGVLACLPDGEVCIGFCDNDEYGVRWQCQSTKKPTHWMPLPAPPTDAK